MALDYYLTVQNPANEITPEQVRRSLAAAFSLQTHEISGILMAPGLSVNVFKEDDEYEASLFGTPYPDVCVAFRVDKFEQYEKGANTMLKMVVWLMAFFNGDMVLSADTEPVILQRISGKLVLNEDAEFWT